MSKKKRIRKHNFSMRLHDVEDILLDLRKDEADLTTSEYLRNIIIFAPAGERPRFPNIISEMLCTELNNVGQKLNDVAYAVNYRRKVTATDMQIMAEEYMNLFTVYDTFLCDKLNNLH